MAIFAINADADLMQPENTTPVVTDRVGVKTGGVGLYADLGKVTWERSSCDLTQLLTWQQYEMTTLTSLDTLVDGVIQRIVNNPSMGRVDYRIADPSGNSSMRFVSIRVEFWNLDV